MAASPVKADFCTDAATPAGCVGGAALELQVDGTVLQVAAAAILISRGLLFIATGLVRLQTSMILEVT